MDKPQLDVVAGAELLDEPDDDEPDDDEPEDDDPEEDDGDEEVDEDESPEDELDELTEESLEDFLPVSRLSVR